MFPEGLSAADTEGGDKYDHWTDWGRRGEEEEEEEEEEESLVIQTTDLSCHVWLSCRDATYCILHPY